MPAASKMRSMRSISCTWYWIVRRSSNTQVMFGPIAIVRRRLWAMTRLRKASRSRAYCSRDIRSAGESRRFSRFIRDPSDAIGLAQQRQRMPRLPRIPEPGRDLVPGHGTVAGQPSTGEGGDALRDRAPDLHRRGMELALDRIGAIVAGTALDRRQLRGGDEREQVAGLEADILHAQVTGNLVGEFAETGREIGAQLPFRMPEHQVLERIERALRDRANLRIVRKQQRQLALEHQHAGGN